MDLAMIAQKKKKVLTNLLTWQWQFVIDRNALIRIQQARLTVYLLCLDIDTLRIRWIISDAFLGMNYYFKFRTDSKVQDHKDFKPFLSFLNILKSQSTRQEYFVPERERQTVSTLSIWSHYFSKQCSFKIHLYILILENAVGRVD